MADPSLRHSRRRRVAGWSLGAWAALLMLWTMPLAARAQEAASAAGQGLQAQRLAMTEALRRGVAGETMVLVSREEAGQLQGDVHADVPFALGTLAARLRSPSGLCVLLFLHLNVRGCQPGHDGRGVVLNVSVGPKERDGPGLRHDMRYRMQVQADLSDYFLVRLQADQGPLSTSNYLLVLEAVPAAETRSFVHVGYGYRFGTLARMAMQAYLGTAGRAKVGFTVEGRDAKGQPRFVDGARGALERNVMRYYLALLAHVGAPEGTGPQALEARLRRWFALTERHAEQLHEYALEDYLRNKRADLMEAPLQ